MPYNPVLPRRLPWVAPHVAAHDFEDVPICRTPVPISPWPTPEDTLWTAPRAVPRRTKGLRPKPRPTSPPIRPAIAQAPPPLPPWPPSPDSLQAHGILPASAHIHWCDEPELAAPKLRGVCRKVAFQPRAARIASAVANVSRPNYGYAWRTGHKRPVLDNKIAGEDIFETVRKRSLQRLQALIEQTPTVLVKADPEYARTPLGWAVIHQRLDVVRMLVSAMHAYGCDTHGELDAPGLDYRTPLMLAIDAAGPDAVGLLDTLLAAGASIHVRTRRVAGALGSFLLISFGSEHHTQDVAEYAVRKARALALHQILKWDEKTPHGPGQTTARVSIDALARLCPKDHAQTEPLQTVLRAARVRRMQSQSATPASELDACMTRLGIAKPGELTRVSR